MAGGKRCLYYQVFIAERSQANIIVVHGLAEHSGRYKNVYDYFGQSHYSLWSLDHYGHGISPGRRCHLRRFNDLSDDLGVFIERVARETPHKPIFIIAHSMGALITLNYLIRISDSPVSGVVTSGLSLKLGASVSRRLIPFAKLLSGLWPILRVQKLDATAISQDATVVKAYLDDERVYAGKITARLGSELIGVMGKVLANMDRLNTPLLILHGLSDRLADPESSRVLFAYAGSRDKTIKLYAGFYHELFNEPGRLQVLLDVKQWLDGHSITVPGDFTVDTC